MSDTETPATPPPSEMDILRAQIAELKAAVAQKTAPVKGVANCNDCGAIVENGGKCEKHPLSTIHVTGTTMTPDGRTVEGTILQSY
jgi:hypothetical protein